MRGAKTAREFHKQEDTVRKDETLPVSSDETTFRSSLQKKHRLKPIWHLNEFRASGREKGKSKLRLLPPILGGQP